LSQQSALSETLTTVVQGNFHIRKHVVDVEQDRYLSNFMMTSTSTLSFENRSNLIKTKPSHSHRKLHVAQYADDCPPRNLHLKKALCRTVSAVVQLRDHFAMHLVLREPVKSDYGCGDGVLVETFPLREPVSVKLDATSPRQVPCPSRTGQKRLWLW